MDKPIKPFVIITNQDLNYSDSKHISYPVDAVYIPELLRKYPHLYKRKIKTII